MSETVRVRVVAAVGGVLVLIAWQLSAAAFVRPSGRAGAVPPQLEVLARVGRDLLDPTYWAGLSVTAGSALAGYAAGAALALLLGVLVLLLPVLEGFAVQIGLLAACLPAAAIAPIVVLLAPPSSRLVAVVLAALAVVFPMVIGVLLGLRAASRTQVDLIRGLGGSEWTVIRRVRLVSALPAVLAALKIGAPSAFLGAIVGEFFAVGVDSGAGRILVSLQYVGDSVGLWATAVLATLASASGYLALALATRLVAPWTAHLGSEDL